MSDTSLVDDGSGIDPSGVGLPKPQGDVVDFRRGTVAQATAPSLDSEATPDRAARAIKLARVTNTKPELIVHDVDHFAKEAKDAVTAGIVGNNKYLREYVRDKPLGPEISQDDWSNLDEISQKADQIYQSPVMKFFLKLGATDDAAQYEHPTMKTFREGGGVAGAATRMLVAGVVGAGEGFKEGAVSYIQERRAQEEKTGATPSQAVTRVAMNPLDTAGGIMMGGMGAATSGVFNAAEELYKSFYPDDSGGANYFARQFAGMVEWKMQDMASHGAAEVHPTAVQNKWWTSSNTQHFVKNGEMLWFDPHLADIMRKTNERHTEAIHEIYDNIQKSSTFERDPQHMADLLKTVYDGNVSISADAVAKLYGDKTPHPEDGILGWVPNIAEQMELAKTVGGDIAIPFKDYITNIKEEHFEALKDNLKVTPFEITKGEEEAAAKAKEERAVVEPEPLAREEAAPEVAPEGAGERPAEAKPEDIYTKETPPDWTQFPDFVSAREVGTPEEKAVVAEPIPKMRESAGLEPLLSIGDRKLTIQRRAFNPKIDTYHGVTVDGAQLEPHVFQLLDENGKKVGFLDIIHLTKDGSLFVANVGGLDKQGYTSNSFGTALTRDLIRQLKLEYPDAKRVGGYRISGAREKAGSERLVWINVDSPHGWDTVENANEFRRILENQPGEWKSFSPSMDAYIQPKEGRKIEDQKVIDIVNEEASRMLGPEVRVQEADRISATRAAGIDRPLEPAGAYIRSDKAWPIILYALEGADPLGTFRHEVIHHLRNYGLIRRPEWEMLVKAAHEHGWIKDFNIESRYPDADMAVKLEEAIADGFKRWSRDKDFAEITPQAMTVFEKMKAFFEGIKDRLAKLLGKEPTFEDFFEQIRSGEVGKRDIAPIDKRLYTEKPLEAMASAPEAKPEAPKEPPPLFRTPGAVGLNAAQARKFEARLREQMTAATEKAQEEAEHIRKDMLDDWKHKRKGIASEVETQIRNQPATAADLMLARGEYYGQRLAEKPKMSFDDLTPEQREGLPKNYYTKEGVEGPYTADQIASMVGFPTGEIMIKHLVEYNKEKLKANMTANDYVKRRTDIETDRIMANELGSLDEAMQDRVNDHLASAAYSDQLAQETLYLGMKAGFEASIDKLSFRNALKETFDEANAANVRSNFYRNQGTKFESQVKTEMLSKDWEAAYKSQQGREAWHVLFGEAVKFEKEKKAFDKLVKKLAAREVKGLDIDFQDQIQDLLMKAGYRTRRSPQEIQTSKNIAGKGTIEKFHNDLRGDGWEPDIAQDILDGNVKDAGEMSVGEWRDFRNAIQSLNSIGRAVNEINILGKKESFADFRREVLTNITSLPMRSRESQTSGIAHNLYGWDAILTRPEAIMKALDLGEDLGPLVNMTIRPLAEAKHKEYSMEEKLSSDIKNMGMDKKWSKTLDKELPNDWFIDPQYGGQTLFKIKRSDLIQVMLNWGNISNQRKFAESWGSSRVGKRATKEEAAAFTKRMDDYINEHATADDWKFVRGIWDIYKGYRGELETLWRNTSGTQPRMIEPRSIVTPHGTFEGGYYPLIRDRIMSGKPEAQIAPNQPFGANYISATTPQGHLKDRTAASYYVDFHGSFTNIPQRMTQVIHDIAFRGEVMQVRQVLQDKAIRNAIRNHYGPEYDAQLDPWLQRTANGATLDETAMQARDTFLRNMRMKLTNYALPFNWKVLGTPDVGLFYPIVGYWGPGREQKLATANRLSKEIPHAIYNMDRDFREAMQKQVGEGKMNTYQAQATRWGYSVVSYVSREFRTATFTKYFNEAVKDGKNEIDAAAIADTYVREHHGSAALHDLPAIMAGGEAGRMMTMFYGYWNTMYNWQRNIPGQVKRGEYMNAVATTWGSVVVGTLFGALIANGAKQEDSVADWFIKALPAQIMGTIPGLREVASFFFDGLTSRTALSTAIEGVGGAYNDVKKWSEGKPVEKGIRHGTAVLGLAPGMPGLPGGLQAGETLQGLYNYAQGRQAPKDIWEWWRLIRTGEAELKHRSQQ